MPANAVLTSFDFIGNPQIRNSHNPSNQLMEQPTVSMLQIYHIRNVNGQPKKYSYCYLCDNPKHGWQMALVACRDYFKSIKSELENVKIFYCFSDRSSKDFSCTSFVAFLTHIWHQLGVSGQWNYTAPEEGKWLHDQSGGCNKGAYERGIKRGRIPLNSSKPFVESIRDYLVDHFNEARFNNSNIIRVFRIIDPKEISTQCSPHQTLQGIKSYYCFRYISKNIIRYRQYPCYCICCINMDFDNCLKKDKCGEWIDKQFKSLSFPAPNCDSHVVNDELSLLPPVPSLQQGFVVEEHRHHPYRHIVNHNM